MFNEVMMVVALVIGMVVGIAGTLMVGWIKRSSADRGKPPVLNPASVGIRRSSKKPGAMTVPTANGVPSEPKKRSGRHAKVCTPVKAPATAPVDAVKKRRGRPTKADVAARQAAMAMEEKATTRTFTSSTMKPAIADQDHLLEMFFNLSKEQLHALAAMPVGEASPAIIKESLTS